jgi:hypothetical protein
MLHQQAMEEDVSASGALQEPEVDGVQHQVDTAEPEEGRAEQEETPNSHLPIPTTSRAARPERAR